MSLNCPKGDEPCIRGCKPWECRDGWPDEPPLNPDIATLKKRMADDPEFAAQVTGDRPPTPVGWSDTDWLKRLEKQDEPLRRGVNGVCIRSTCECEREGLGDQCIYLRPKDYPAYKSGPLPETGWD